MPRRLPKAHFFAAALGFSTFSTFSSSCPKPLKALLELEHLRLGAWPRFRDEGMGPHIPKASLEGLAGAPQAIIGRGSSVRVHGRHLVHDICELLRLSRRFKGLKLRAFFT